jgi:hypothetical protein
MIEFDGRMGHCYQSTAREIDWANRVALKENREKEMNDRTIGN